MVPDGGAEQRAERTTEHETERASDDLAPPAHATASTLIERAIVPQSAGLARGAAHA
jgi:hypothetical protein